jgi:hypothetical protein
MPHTVFCRIKRTGWLMQLKAVEKHIILHTAAPAGAAAACSPKGGAPSCCMACVASCCSSGEPVPTIYRASVMMERNASAERAHTGSALMN